MRTIMPILAMVALGVAAMMVGMSGFNAAVGEDPTSDLQSGEKLNNSTGDGVASGGSFNGSAGGERDGDIVGLIISGGSAFVGFVQFLAFMPIELRSMGFPWFFALPIGLGAQLIASIGFVEAVTQRELT